VGKNNARDRENPHHIRRVIIVSTDLYNTRNLGYIVVPVLRWRPGREAPPTNSLLEIGEGGVSEPSVVWCTQIRAVAPWRMKLRLGVLSLRSVTELKDALRITFDLI
jgi:mRNA-degrading endonuclease toxin of MazEF toxin-antitoxin module